MLLTSSYTKFKKRSVFHKKTWFIMQNILRYECILSGPHFRSVHTWIYDNKIMPCALQYLFYQLVFSMVDCICDKGASGVYVQRHKDVKLPLGYYCMSAAMMWRFLGLYRQLACNLKSCLEYGDNVVIHIIYFLS